MVLTKNISIAWIGRFTGPKGELATIMLTKVVPLFPEIQFTFVGGPINQALKDSVPANVRLTGFIDNVAQIIANNDLIIGAGRVVLEALQVNKPVIAVGESAYIGLINDSTIDKGKATNFGDCAAGYDVDISLLVDDIHKFCAGTSIANNVHYMDYLKEYNAKIVHQNVMNVYCQARVDSYLSRFKEVPILMYHRVVNEAPANSKFNIYVATDELEKQLISLKKRGFTSTTFKEIVNGYQVKKPVLLTFDDGYEDNHANLLPLLKKHQMKATIFVLGNRQLESNKWDADLGEASFPLMTDAQIKECHQSGLIEIASHGLQHKHLPQLTDNDLRNELIQSRKNIETIIEDKVVTFAYPYGDYTSREVKAVSDAGYVFGVGTVNGPLRMSDDYFRIRRINMFPGTRPLMFWKKTSGYYLRYCRLKGKDF